MAEVVVELMQVVTDAEGEAYGALACGNPTPDGTWQGWVEFVPAHGGQTLRTPRETTQPARDHVVYWATGLTAVYLEGAFERAEAAKNADAAARSGEAPVSTAGRAAVTSAPGGAAATADAILDPFSVYQKGEALLRRQLGALEPWHLVNIIVAYDLSFEPRAVLVAMPRAALVDLIVGRVATEAQPRPSRARR